MNSCAETNSNTKNEMPNDGHAISKANNKKDNSLTNKKPLPVEIQKAITDYKTIGAAVVDAFRDKHSERWVDYLPLPSELLESAKWTAEHVRTPLAQKRLKEMESGGAEQEVSRTKERIAKSIKIARLYFNKCNLLANEPHELYVWRFEKPINIIEKMQFNKKQHNAYKLKESMLMLSQAHSKGAAFTIIEMDSFSDYPYRLYGIMPLGYSVINKENITFSILFSPSGYDIWTEDMGIPVPALGMSWGKPIEKRRKYFELIIDYEGEISSENIVHANMMALHFSLIEYQRKEVAYWTQKAFSGKTILVKPEKKHNWFSIWSQKIAKEEPKLKLKRIIIKKWH